MLRELTKLRHDDHLEMWNEGFQQIKCVVWIIIIIVHGGKTALIEKADDITHTRILVSQAFDLLFGY